MSVESYFIATSKRISGPVGLAVAFVAFEALLFAFVDRPIAAYTHALDTSAHGLIEFFRSITDLGKGAWYLWPCGVATILGAFLSRGQDVPPRYRRLFGYVGVRAFYIFAVIALSGIAANIIKPFVGRARPLLWLRDGIYGFDPFGHPYALWNSIPSGHTTTAFAFAFALAKLYPRATPVWYAYALCLALSRVMVDAHYLSDVCAGAMLAALTVELFTKHGMKPLSKVIFPIDKAPALL